MEVWIYMIFRNGNFFCSNNQQFTTTIIDQWYSTNIQYCPSKKESDTMPWLNFIILNIIHSLVTPKKLNKNYMEMKEKLIILKLCVVQAFASK